MSKVVIQECKEYSIESMVLKQSLVQRVIKWGEYIKIIKGEYLNEV